MPATMMREAWTDERLDDLSKQMGHGFAEVKAEIKSTRGELKDEIASTRAELKEEISSTRAELKGEISSTKAELKEEISSTRVELKSEIAAINSRFDKLTYTLIAALIGLLATHYLG